MTSEREIEALARDCVDAYTEAVGEGWQQPAVKGMRAVVELIARRLQPARVPAGWAILNRPDDGHLVVSGPHGGLCPDPNSPRLAERTLHALGTALLAAAPAAEDGMADTLERMSQDYDTTGRVAEAASLRMAAMLVRREQQRTGSRGEGGDA